jgi:flagellar biosynthesis/type III secretory pathway M-ring protein FliF/YscJ
VGNHHRARTVLVVAVLAGGIAAGAQTSRPSEPRASPAPAGADQSIRPVQDRLTTTLQKMLDMVLGQGNSVVTVTADLDVAVRVTIAASELVDPAQVKELVIAAAGLAADCGDSVRVSTVGDFSDAVTMTLD